MAASAEARPGRAVLVAHKTEERDVLAGLRRETTGLRASAN
jgi:hypothetical protein